MSNFDYSKTYYTITNKEETLNGFPLKDGLIDLSFPAKVGDKIIDGVYFSDICSVFGDLDYNGIIGYYVREVTVPEDALIAYNCKASKVILGERKELNLDTIKYLIEQGADVNFGFKAPLRWASQIGYSDIIFYLLENYLNTDDDKNQALVWNSECGHLEVVKYLIDNGANVYFANNIALQFASRNGHLDVVNYLAFQGADIHAKNDEALRLAYKYGHVDVAKYLVYRGASIHDGEKSIQVNDYSEFIEYFKGLKNNNDEN